MSEYTDKQKVINQMLSIANGDRLAITVFKTGELDAHLNMSIIRMLDERKRVCQRYFSTDSIEGKEIALSVFEQYNEQIKQLLGL
jgi:hypothetical protein